MQCERYRRYGGAFSFGQATWQQGKSEAVVFLTVTQEGVTNELPACMSCWNECIEKNIAIKAARPVSSKALSTRKEDKHALGQGRI